MLLKTAGVLSLFSAIDTANKTLLNEIEKYFQIEKNVIIEKLQLLYTNEIAHENYGVYKIADQILGEYIFYISFIKNQNVPFSTLLTIYHQKRTFNLKKLLTPITLNYGYENIKDLISGDIKKVWNEIAGQPSSISYLKIFWVFMPIEVLAFF